VPAKNSETTLSQGENMKLPLAPQIAGIETDNRVRELLDCFLSGRNKNTIEAYRIDLEVFREFLGDSDSRVSVSRLLDLSPGEANGTILRYRNSLVKKSLKANTINRKLAALRSLVKLARTLGVVTWSIEIPNLKVEAYRDTRGPGRAAIQEMLALLEGAKRSKDVRDYAILRLLYDLALRATELVGINAADLILSERTVAILGKGKLQSTCLSLPQATGEAVSAWMAIRDPEELPLFYNLDRSGARTRLTRSGLYQIIRKLGTRVGVKTRPHGIRHTSISQAIKVAQLNGITLPEVRQFSRHASLQTLQIYADQERNLFGRIASLVSQSAIGANKIENGAEGNDRFPPKEKK
jgi:integrase/recombinase XerC